MHLCHPEIQRNISQQLVAIHDILANPIIQKIYYSCGNCVFLREDSSLSVISVTRTHNASV